MNKNVPHTPPAAGSGDTGSATDKKLKWQRIRISFFQWLPTVICAVLFENAGMQSSQLGILATGILLSVMVIVYTFRFFPQPPIQ
ncbi:MAG: hypothetical protein M3Q97_09505 [Bacteroidota bacterium]|nr:hypothetical protein [Bacteroidota bacterium]